MLHEISVPKTITRLLNIHLSFHSCIYEFIFAYFTTCEVLSVKYVVKMLHDKTAGLRK